MGFDCGTMDMLSTLCGVKEISVMGSTELGLGFCVYGRSDPMCYLGSEIIDSSGPALTSGCSLHWVALSVLVVASDNPLLLCKVVSIVHGQSHGRATLLCSFSF